MFRVRNIDSLDLPELQPYRTMRRQQAHREEGIFIAEGQKVLMRLLESRFEVISMLMPEARFEEFRVLVEARPETVEVFFADKRLLETLTGFVFYQGILAIGRVPVMPSLPELIQSAKRPLLLVGMDSLANAENVGALVRSSAAFGAEGLILDGASSSPYLRRAVRSSMGTVFELPIVESQDLCEALVSLRAAGVRIVAAHPHVSARTLWQTDLRQDVCLLFGSEGQGISDRVLKLCDDLAAIPMAGRVDSLNVASASAVFLAEARRQRLVSGPLGSS